MNFTQAIELLTDGVKITRSSWYGNMYLQKENLDTGSCLKATIKTYVKAVSNYSWSVEMFLSTDWMIGNDDSITVKFAEAIQALKTGYRVKLPEWKDMYLEFDGQSKTVVLHHWVSHDYQLSFNDFCEEDWKQF